MRSRGWGPTAHDARLRRSSLQSARCGSSRSSHYRSEVLIPVAFREFRVAGSCAHPSCMNCKGEADHSPRGNGSVTSKGKRTDAGLQRADVHDLGPNTREPTIGSTFALTAASVWALLDIQDVLHNSWLMREWGREGL